MESPVGEVDHVVPRTPAGLRESYVLAVAVVWAAFHIYAGLRHVNILQLVHIHVCLALSLTFAVRPSTAPFLPERGTQALDTVLASIPLVILGYLLTEQQRLLTRIPQVAEVTTVDLLLGTLLLLLVLEASRRITGAVLPAIGLLFLVYAFAGPMFPGLLEHGGIDYERIIDLMFLDDRGIFGIPAKVSARYVFLFVLFGAILVHSGAGTQFLDLARAIGGEYRGGAAKIAVMTSAIMASINGSAVANTVSTGSITIPLMSDSGYDDESSGAIESLASTGGQLMPPVMGAAAFVLAELSGTPYLDLIIYAIVPSLLFYLAVFTSVHLEALKQDIPPIPRDELPATGPAARATAHLAIPIVGLLYILYATRNIELAAGATVLLTFGSVQLHPDTRIGPVECFRACRRGAEMVLAAALPCAVAGIVIGVVFFSGLGARLTSLILSLTGGSLVITLLFVAVVAIILGMGMPTTGAYITVAVLAIPTLTELGIDPLSAHMFGLYFAVFSMITPPIAIAAFAASSISGADPMGTGIRAFKLGVATYAVPFLFVLNPVLLLQGATVTEALFRTALAAVVVVLASIVGVGHLVERLTLPERLVIAAGCLVVVFVPSYLWAGIGVAAIGLLNQARLKIGIEMPVAYER